MKILHVYPINDSHAHLFECVIDLVPVCKCPCNPRHEFLDDSHIVIHDAFDGRLGVEWANEILNQQ